MGAAVVQRHCDSLDAYEQTTENHGSKKILCLMNIFICTLVSDRNSNTISSFCVSDITSFHLASFRKAQEARKCRELGRVTAWGGSGQLTLAGSSLCSRQLLRSYKEMHPPPTESLCWPEIDLLFSDYSPCRISSHRVVADMENGYKWFTHPW